MKFKGLSCVILIVASTIAISGCYVHWYSYDLDRQYLGLSDCEINLHMKSLNSHRRDPVKDGDYSFVFSVGYQCISAAPEQTITISDVTVSRPDGSDRTSLSPTDSSTWKDGTHLIGFGPFINKRKRLDSILISFNLSIPEGMAGAYPRSGHYEVLGTLHDDRFGIYTWISKWD